MTGAMTSGMLMEKFTESFVTLPSLYKATHASSAWYHNSFENQH